MAATIAPPAVNPQADTDRITALERAVALLAAELKQYRSEDCTLRSLERIWAGTSPGPASRARAQLRLAASEGERLILEAAGR